MAHTTLERPSRTTRRVVAAALIIAGLGALGQPAMAEAKSKRARTAELNLAGRKTVGTLARTIVALGIKRRQELHDIPGTTGAIGSQMMFNIKTPSRGGTQTQYDISALVLKNQKGNPDFSHPQMIHVGAYTTKRKGPPVNLSFDFSYDQYTGRTEFFGNYSGRTVDAVTMREPGFQGQKVMSMSQLDAMSHQTSEVLYTARANHPAPSNLRPVL